MSNTNESSATWSLWSWLLPLIPALLALIANIFARARDQQLIQAGVDQEVAAQAKVLLELTESGKKLLAKVEAMPDKELNDLLKDLGK